MARLVAPSAPGPQNPFASALGDPVSLAPTGADFLDDAAPGADLLLGLPASLPSHLCGLAPTGARAQANEVPIVADPAAIDWSIYAADR